MKKKNQYTAGQALTGFIIFILIYTYFYTNIFHNVPGRGGEWTQSLALSMTAILTGMLMELSRFWGWVIEFKTDSDLLIFQGIPAAILSLIPAPLWLQAGGDTFPFVFFANPVVTGMAGVWFGMVLFRGMFNNKKVKEEEEDKKKAPREA